VINLSNRVLTKREIKLLSKGLKFTPIPKSNHHELKKRYQRIDMKIKTGGIL
jgi:hypothetical protein